MRQTWFHRLCRSVVAVGGSFGLLLGIAVPAHASSAAMTLPNGCRILATNHYSSNYATAYTHKVSGYPCYRIDVNFTYYDSTTGTYRYAWSGYLNAPTVSVGRLTNVAPVMSSHNAEATAGGARWGFGLYF